MNMDNPVILVVDADPKNLQILREGLESSGFTVLTASDGQEAWEKIYTERPDLVLSEVSLPNMDGFQLLERIKQDPTTANIPIMFLTNRREIQDRVRSLRGGVKDYMIKPLHVKEVIARIRMILRRLERMRNYEIEPSKKLVGRLEEYSVADLIENFGVERKSGVLTVYNENNRNGEIYFRNGAVVHATLGTLKAEKAVYQMLPWKRGHFIMTFKDVDVPDTISVSNLGLLLHGFKRMEEREKLFKMLPSPETTFVITESFRKILAKKELSAEAAKFLTLIDGKRDIMQIIDDSSYDDLKTLDKLARLYQQGFIKPGHAGEAAPPEIKVADLSKKAVEEKQETEGVVSGSVKNGSSIPVDLINVSESEPPDESAALAPASAVSNKEPEVQEFKDIKEPDFPHLGKEEHGEAQEPGFHPDESQILTPSTPPPVEASKEKAAVVGTEDPLHLSQDLESAAPSMSTPVPPSQAQAGRGSGEVPPKSSGRQDMNIPEPMQIDHFKPGIDILEALAKFSPPEPEAPELPQEIAPAESEPMDTAEHELVESTKPEQSEPKAEEPQPPEPRPIDEPASLPDELPEILKPMPEREPGPAHEPPSRETREKQPAAPATESRKPVTAGRPVKKLPDRKLPVITEQEADFPDIDHITQPAAGVKPPASEEPQPPGSRSEDELYIAQRIEPLLKRLAESAVAPPAKLVLIGAKIEFIEQFAAFLLGNAPMKKFQSRIFEFLGVGERKVGDQSLVIVGVSMEQQFTQLLDSLADGFAGYILLIDGTSKENLDYISYLHSALKEKYKKPFGIALVKVPGTRNLAVETVRDLIGAERLDLIQSIDPVDKMSMMQFIQAMLADQNFQRWQMHQEADRTH